MLTPAQFVHRVRRDVAHFLRVTGFAVVFVSCCAFSCFQVNPDIQYAAGYGYVVKAFCYAPCGGRNSSDYYAIFDTYEQASDWLNRWNHGQSLSLPPGYVDLAGDQGQIDESGRNKYDRITPLLGPVPAPYSSSSIGPNQPHPFVPQ